ncbi:MAG: transaldolase [bacterium]|nr:transaldolase [bacterium]
MPSLEDLRVKLFADGADRDAIRELSGRPYIRGFTTNPTLMRKAGVADFEAFAKELLTEIRDRPISFEVFADDFAEMERQAHRIASWAENVYVKIPVTNTKRESSAPLVRRLTRAGVKLNVTALLTLDQVSRIGDALAGGSPSIVSVFAGRIADSGRDPVPHMAKAATILRPEQQIELLWASPREVLNIFQADTAGCHIITVGKALLDKLPLIGQDLDERSLETVKMFHSDARAAGYEL